MACCIRRALISVYDKTGIVDFARALHAEFGIEIISTGGTAKTLQEAGIPVALVEQITGFCEMLDGRVKTLHPRIHAAILADRDNPEHMRQLAEQGIQPIDLLAVNLYPFEQTIAQPGCTFEEAIEMIDIGGPCLLRAAAKNHRHVLTVSNPRQYEIALALLRERQTQPDDSRRRMLALDSFWQTTGYDGAIVEWLSSGPAGDSPRRRVLRLLLEDRTSYGENPQQRGWLFAPAEASSALNLGRALAGGPAVEMSFNNYADAGAALELCAELTRAGLRAPLFTADSVSDRSPAPAVCFIKHTNACGAAVVSLPDLSSGTEPRAACDALHAARVEAYSKAYLGDPNAAMGGILAVNFVVDADFAAAVMETYQRWGKPLRKARTAHAPAGFFLEVWLAPAFDDDAVKVIRTRKEWGRRVRLLAVGDMSGAPDPAETDLRRIAGGILMQTRDLVGLDEQQWKVVTEQAPTAAELNDLRLAWLICKHTKSNAVTICKNGMLLGNGAGQMSRVMSCRIATWLATDNGYEQELEGAVAASDGFFPFRDGPDLLADAGATALIQPGGSKNDRQVIDACNERGVAMIFTGTRHFRH